MLLLHDRPPEEKKDPSRQDEPDEYIGAPFVEDDEALLAERARTGDFGPHPVPAEKPSRKEIGITVGTLIAIGAVAFGASSFNKPNVPQSSAPEKTAPTLVQPADPEAAINQVPMSQAGEKDSRTIGQLVRRMLRLSDKGSSGNMVVDKGTDKGDNSMAQVHAYSADGTHNVVLSGNTAPGTHLDINHPEDVTSVSVNTAEGNVSYIARQQKAGAWEQSGPASQAAEIANQIKPQ